MATVSIPAGFRSLPLPAVQLSLAAVLKCGQSFRWTSYPLTSPTDRNPSACPTHEYRLCLRDWVVCLRQSPEALFYRSAETLTWLNDYFQLDIDLAKLYDEWSDRDTVFYNLRSRFSGIRMLRQDPWENLVSTMPVEALAYHPFPPPSVLAAPEVAPKLRSLGFGYRANYIQRTAKMLIDEHGSAVIASDQQCGLEAPEKWLVTLRNLETLKAREELLRFVGVGRKVADCILLMSLDKKEVIPVDTHVHQIAIKHYGFRPAGSKGKVAMTPKLYDEINSKLGDTLGRVRWLGPFGMRSLLEGFRADAQNGRAQVLFTADLKAFSSYGIPMTSSILVGATPSSTTPSDTSSESGKRTREKVLEGGDLHNPLEADMSLPEPVKKRGRIIEVTAS
ncbi:DNA glycosylase [Melanogaster broomeanus]|nr:DNA glycosylase [Melanogaster broomeanus]